jgi:type II secretory pathway component PulK
MRKLSPSSKRDSGAALLLALWALFLLAGVVFAWALNINSRLTVSATANRVLEAEAMASSGADVALTREISRSSPNLHRKMGERQRYDVEMSGECGRLDLNWITLNEDLRKVGILRQYLTLKVVEMSDIDVMMDSLLDWVSPNKGLRHLNAPEESDNYRPPHAPLNSLDELKKVFGWAEFTSKPGWDQDFTVLPITVLGQYRIDLAWASRDVLRALLAAFGAVADDRVDAFLQLRRGPDGVDGTEDDTQFTDLNDALTRGLGLNSQQIPQIQNLVGLNLPILRIVSVGKSSDATRSVQMVVQKQVMPVGVPAGVGAAIAVGPPTVVSWKEL